MEEEKPKRGRPRKEVVSETAIVPVDDDDEPWVPVPKRTRKKKEPPPVCAPEVIFWGVPGECAGKCSTPLKTA